MPYGRRTRMSRSRRARRGYPRGRVTGYMSSVKRGLYLARQAVRGVRYLRSLVNVEKKKFDAENIATIGTGAVTPVDPSLIAQGDSDQSRNGNSILVNGLLLKGTMVKHASSGSQRMRILVLIDLQQVADSDPSYTNIIDPSFTDQILAPLNNESVGRYKILMNRVFTLDTNKPNQTFQTYFKLSHHIRYNGTASTDVQKGGIYVFAVGDDNTNQAALTIQSRTYFYDN